MAFSGGQATDDMVIKNGLVGIGTTAPATKLHVSSGTFTLDGTGAGIYTTGTSTAAAFCLSGDCKTAWTSASTFDVTVGTVSTALILGNGAIAQNAPVLIWLQNNNASPVSSGSIVIAEGDNGFNTTTSEITKAIGVTYDTIAAGAFGRVAVAGVIRAVCSEDTTVGEHATTSGTAGKALGTGFPNSGASIGIWLEACDVDINGSGNLLLK